MDRSISHPATKILSNQPVVDRQFLTLFGEERVTVRKMPKLKQSASSLHFHAAWCRWSLFSHRKSCWNVAAFHFVSPPYSEQPYQQMLIPKPSSVWNCWNVPISGNLRFLWQLLSVDDPEALVRSSLLPGGLSSSVTCSQQVPQPSSKSVLP